MTSRRNTERRWKTIDDLAKEAYDDYAPALTVISEPHRLIHDGKYFNASGIEATVANGATLDLLIKFPVGAIGHLTLVEFALDDAPVNLKFYEGTTVSADGSAINIRNHNRVVANDSSNATMFVGPTVTDVGTLLHERHIPSPGTSGNQPAGTLVPGEDQEWVLGNGSAINYMWRITNNSGGAITVGYHFNGYEL